MAQQQQRSIPDVDIDGFVPNEDFAKRALRMVPQEYARVYNVPALLVDQGPDDAKPPGAGGNVEVPSKRLEGSYRKTTDEDERLPDPVTMQLRYANRIAFLVKRPGNLFPEMISIGRALNCDVVLALSSSSKIHGLIHQEAGNRWTYSDQASRNGTFLNGQRLNPGDRYPLTDGDRLLIGLHFACIFLEPASLLARFKKR